MNLPKNVKPFPRILEKTLWKRYKGNTTFRYIFLRSDIYKNLLSDKPKIENRGILIHEQTYERRIKNVNKLLYFVRFWLDAKFRFREELAASKVQMRYLRKNGGRYDIKKRAKSLSGPVYWWCISYDEAKKELDKIWG